MKTEEKYINITSKLETKKQEELEKMKMIDNIAGNMINALAFIIEESRDSRNIRKVKNMLGMVIKELQGLQKKI